MSDFDRVAAQMNQNRVGAPWAGVGAPWAGVGGPTVVFPPVPTGGVGRPTQAVDASGRPVQVNMNPTYTAANSYFGLTNTNPAENEILPGQARTFTRRPQRAFQPLQLIFMSRVTGLLIQSISIANNNFMSHSEDFGVPAEFFSEPSQAMGLLWAQIDPAIGVSLRVFNTNANAVQLLAGFAGIQLQ